MHKTLVKVNEEGTVAAAVTGGILTVLSVKPSIRLNRPFFFIIHSEYDVLFMGAYKKP